MTANRHNPLLLLLLAMAPLASAQQANISGTVVDATGASIAHTQVKLALNGRAPDQETQSTPTGDFSFANVAPGPYSLSFIAKGFALKTISGELHPDESLNLAPVALALDTLTTQVTVTQTSAELADAQIKLDEQQRLIGLFPNFFAEYNHDAEPLNATQKLKLTARSWFDPSSFVIEGIIAGVGQLQNSHKGFGQGAQGYAKRYGAGFVDYGTRLLVERVITTTIFKQDPRYFYKGTGTKTSRALYAISRTFICRGDNKKDQFCISRLISGVGTDFATNYYYPTADRDKTSDVLRHAAMGLGFESLGNLFQEFVARKITRKKH